jgi:hypothetical protein
MFHWICPECGREIAPSMKECPACDPSAPAPAAARPAPVEVALTPEVVSTPVGSIRGQWRSAGAVIVDAEPAPACAPEPEPPAAAAALLVEEEPPVPLDPLAMLAEAVQAGHLPIPGWLDRVAGPQPQLRGKDGEPEQSVPAPVPPGHGPHEPSLPDAGRTHTQRHWLATQCMAAVPRGFVGPEAFAPGPPLRPALEKASAAPPLGELCEDAAAVERIRPARPSARPKGAAGPGITLAGPTLPPELVSLTAAGISAPLTNVAPRPAGGARMPGWMVSLLVAVGLAGACLGLVFYLVPGMLAERAPATTPPSAPRAASSPLAQYVEVTGFRFITDAKRNPEIHYLVVNHSSALLNGVTVFVTLRSRAAQPNQPPLSQFSFRMPNLGPYESREMTSAIEKVTRPGPLPDWRDLIVQVDVAP